MGKYDKYLEKLREIQKQYWRTPEEKEFVKQMLEEVYRDIVPLSKELQVIIGERDKKIQEVNEVIKKIREEYSTIIKEKRDKIKQLKEDIPFIIERELIKINFHKSENTVEI